MHDPALVTAYAAVLTGIAAIITALKTKK